MSDEDAPVWQVTVKDFEVSNAIYHRGYVVEYLSGGWCILTPDNQWLRGVKFTYLTEALRFVDKLR